MGDSKLKGQNKHMSAPLLPPQREEALTGSESQNCSWVVSKPGMRRSRRRSGRYTLASWRGRVKHGRMPLSLTFLNAAQPRGYNVSDFLAKGASLDGAHLLC
jgi:hypothetical protein